MVFRRNPPDPEALRQLAMARLSERDGAPAAVAMDQQQVRHLLEELEIRQIELELQNEHLNTARAQLEQALNQSNEIYDFSPVGSVLIDTDGVITKLNLASAQLFASERARLLGSKLGLYVAEAQRTQFNAMLARARAEHEVQTGELIFQVNDQDPSLVQAKVVWIGAAVGWQIALVDISERRLMEAKLHASEERLTLALSAVGDGVWDWQVDSGEVLVSEDCAELRGYFQDELGLHISDLVWRVHPDDKPQLMQKLQDCITGMSDRLYNEHRLHCKDGRWKWVLVRGAVVHRAGDAQALRIIGTQVDVSHNKEAEAALAVAAQFQQAVFDAISAQIAVLDQDGVILQTNAAWHSYVSEYGFVESVGRNYLTLLEDLFVVRQATLEAMATGLAAVAAGEMPNFQAMEPVQCQCRRCWFTIKITPIHDAAHRMVATHEDVSVLKQAELASVVLANVDTLTGALSRQYFMRLAEQELVRSHRYELPLVVLMIDLDHFKRINDTYGHQAGDAVLQAFVQTVKSVLRESDVMGRIGGEGFAVLLSSTTQEGGSALANRMIGEVRLSPVLFDDKCIAYTISIGAASLSNQASFAALLAQSDAALYRAKNGGRDRLELNWDNSLAQSTDEWPRNLTA